MSEMRERARPLHVRIQHPLLATLGERNEHHEQLRHQCQGTAEGAQPVMTSRAAARQVNHRDELQYPVSPFGATLRPSGYSGRAAMNIAVRDFRADSSFPARARTSVC